VVHVEHLGVDTNVYLDSEQAGLLTVRLFGASATKPDDIVFATPRPGTLHRFGPDGRAMGQQ
jgi:multiple sugar transport system ATP-binding protein